MVRSARTRALVAVGVSAVLAALGVGCGRQEASAQQASTGTAPAPTKAPVAAPTPPAPPPIMTEPQLCALVTRAQAEEILGVTLVDDPQAFGSACYYPNPTFSMRIMNDPGFGSDGNEQAMDSALIDGIIRTLSPSQPHTQFAGSKSLLISGESPMAFFASGRNVLRIEPVNRQGIPLDRQQAAVRAFAERVHVGLP